jgi:hypothetical protein
MGPVVDHIDEGPLEELTLRVAPFVGEGVRELAIPTPTGDLRISYRASGGRHVVTTSSAGSIALEALGPDAPALEHRSE